MFPDVRFAIIKKSKKRNAWFQIVSKCAVYSINWKWETHVSELLPYVRLTIINQKGRNLWFQIVAECAVYKNKLKLRNICCQNVSECAVELVRLSLGLHQKYNYTRIYCRELPFLDRGGRHECIRRGSSHHKSYQYICIYKVRTRLGFRPN